MPANNNYTRPTPVLFVGEDGSPISFGAASNTSSAVSVSNFPASQAVSGIFWQATQPVSVASLPLPAGAATAALQPALNADGGALVHVQNTLAVDAASRRIVVPPAGSGTDASGSAPAVGNVLATLTVATPGAYYVQNQSAATLQVVFDAGGATPGAASVQLLAPGSGAGQQGGDTAPAMGWFTGRIRVCGPTGSQFMARSN